MLETMPQTANQKELMDLPSPESLDLLESQKLSNTDESVIPQAFCLRWNTYQSNLTTAFVQLLQDEQFVDVTLACDGYSIKAHKMVLSACSPYFQRVFHENPCQHPVIIMRDVRWIELKSVVEFMYKGEINVSQEQIEPLLRVAQLLMVRGLADVNTTSPDSKIDELSESSSHHCDTMKRIKSPKRSRLYSKDFDDCILDYISSKNVAKYKKNQHQERVPSVDHSVESHVMSSYLSAFDDSNILDKGSGIMDTNIIDDEKTNSIEHSSWLCGPSTSSNVKEFYEGKDPLHLLSSNKNYTHFLKLKPPTWTQGQLRDAISAVVTQKLRFTQASAKYNIPKGTLYDNILGKSNRMQVLDEAGIDASDEKQILEFVSDPSYPPYNRRTKKPLAEIMDFVQKICKLPNNPFKTNSKFCFRWWWAFCKKYSIVSLYFDNYSSRENSKEPRDI